MHGLRINDPRPELFRVVSEYKLTESAGVGDIASAGDEFLQYIIDTSRESQAQCLRDLEQYIDEEGPFDGLLAFSQGAGCGATYLIHQSQQGLQPAFRFAVFFCGAPALDPRALFTGCEGNLEDEIITIPTAHIWGHNDELWHFGPALSRLCQSKVKEQYVHEGGHEVPGARDPMRLACAVRAIRRTITRAHATK